MNEDMKPIEKLSFREAMIEIDSIVSTLESNSLELEDSLKSYERGVTLLSHLRTRLDGAQQRVDILMGELAHDSNEATTTDTTLS